MIVDYSLTANHACRLEFPGEAVGMNPKKLIDDIVAEIVPPSMRGKEKGKYTYVSGGFSVSTTTYENLAISEPMNGHDRTAVTVTFHNPDCAIQTIP